MVKVVVAGVSELLRVGLTHCLLGQGQIDLVGTARTEAALAEVLGTMAVDAVVLDPTMAHDSAESFVARLVHTYPGIRLLLLTDEQAWGRAVKLVRAGALGVVGKNDSAEIIGRAVMQVGCGRPYVNQHLAEQLALALFPAPASTHQGLSARELQVFKMLAQGKSVSGIAEQLGLSVKTISTHKTRLMQRMQLGSISELVQYALAHGLITPERFQLTSTALAPERRTRPRAAAPEPTSAYS